MKTYVLKASEIKQKWYIVDLSNKILGRAATQIAMILRGKIKPTFTPYMDMGDIVVVINAAQVKLSGKKLKEKLYYRHSGYPGGLSAISAEKLLAKAPEEVIRKAVRGMLPKNRLGDELITKLRIYKGNEHPHQAQQPEVFNITE
jgi:large subunit ribosomal protein L13